MKILIALGNPGKKYVQTRHNAGWLALDFFAKSNGLGSAEWQKGFDSEFLISDKNSYDAPDNPEKILFVKPQTFMNESGTAVKKICDFYKFDLAKDVLILHDEIDLPLGTIRTTVSSSAAGHNGIKDIIEKLGTQDFHRIRIGVESRTPQSSPFEKGGKNFGIPTEAFVLQNFNELEIKKLQEEIFPKVEAEIEKFLEI